ncbi:site-specific integrase [Vibrio parahaemolyticus]|uniref:site-specific integrase n=1 Tax=Vibrio parahaemolyticus TaxID=670 RepID=UPI003B685DC4
MTYLVHSSDVFKETELQKLDNGSFHCVPSNDNIGSLPTLFSQGGVFNHEANSYLFYLKAVKKAEDLSPCAQALRAYYQFLEDKGLHWDEFPPVKRLKPTYLYRSHLLKQIKQGELAHSTASVRMNQIVNYYKWLMHDGYLRIKNEKEAPFKMEFVSVQNSGMLAHISPTFLVETSDLRIKVPRDADSKNIRPLIPLSRDALGILTQHLPQTSEEFRLQALLAIDTGMRAEEVATLSLDALDTATPLAESQHRFEILLCPRSTGVQTKFRKTRTVETSSDLLQSLNEYRISERRLKRVANLNAKIKRLDSNAPPFTQNKLSSPLENSPHLRGNKVPAYEVATIQNEKRAVEAELEVTLCEITRYKQLEDRFPKLVKIVSPLAQKAHERSVELLGNLNALSNILNAVAEK